MTIDATIADELTKPKTRRNGRGQYLVTDPEGGAKLVPYSRATTISKVLDDTSNLEKWSGRMVALGLTARPDLLALVSAAEADDKRALNDIVERAKEAGGATARRDLGTALHSILEKSWTPGYEPPATYAADVVAVHRALAEAGLTVVEGMAERVIVHDDLRIAGTFDLMVADADGQHYIADIKTGSSVTYGGLGFACQLAIYANATALYIQGPNDKGTDDRREPMPPVSREAALIIHVEPASGRCDLHWLDIALGAEALDLAMKVREIRKAKPLTPLEVVKVAASRHEWVCGRIDDVKAHSTEAATALGRRWPVGVPTRGKLAGAEWTDEQCDAIEAVVVEVCAEHGVPFPTMLSAEPPTRATEPPRRPMPDEGVEVDPETIAALQRYVGDLNPDERAWLMAIAASAKHAGRPITLKDKPSERRWLIVRALWRLATVEPSDDLLRQLVGAAMGEEVQPSVSLGLAVGSLSIDEAELLGRLVDALGGALGVAYDADGTVRLAGDVAEVIAA